MMPRWFWWMAWLCVAGLMFQVIRAAVEPHFGLAVWSAAWASVIAAIMAGSADRLAGH